MYRILRLQKEYTGITIRTQNIDREASAGLKPLKNLVYLGPGTLRNLVVKYCYFVCCISSSRFGVEPGPTAHDLVFVVQRCNSTEFFFYWTVSHRRKIGPNVLVLSKVVGWY